MPPDASDLPRRPPAHAVLLAVLLALALSSAIAGADRSAARAGASPLIAAGIAWERGDYPEALQAYLSLLDSQEGDAGLEPIALRTGELFKTVELTRDGDGPAFSPDGRHLAYEVGGGIHRRIRVARVDAPTQPLLELPGSSAAFSPDGAQLAYVRLPPTQAMRDLEAAAQRATGPERNTRLAELRDLADDSRRIAVRSVVDGTDREVTPAAGRLTGVLLGAGGVVLSARTDAAGTTQIFRTTGTGPGARLTVGDAARTLLRVNSSGTAALFTEGPAEGGRFGVVSMNDGRVTIVNGSAPAFSGDGERLAYVARMPARWRLMIAPTANPSSAVTVREGVEPVDAPALSGDGSRIAFQMMTREDWELHVINGDGSGERRLTYEIQHDLAPRFLTGERLLAVMGEARHRRSYLYDVRSGERTRLFHNNTVRTIAPEYRWAHSPDGAMVLIVADRDGDTISPARGVYLMDLTKTVTREELRARLAGNLAAENALRERGRRMYGPLARAVQRVVEKASTARVWEYQHALFTFDSKHISRRGNRRAADYLYDTYRSLGYEPEYQTFAAREALGGRTANVIATLRGTVNPELVYVVSSHYDSVQDSPGADDNTSGTAALLETARILAAHPQPATIVFASFTGEESGLLGSREFVRRALVADVRIVGALNNDMIGWADDHRLDNTIRSTSEGIRDALHAAAIGFSRLITYDARYVRGTDGEAYFEAYGDIVGGIGSYPVLGNPHYHEPHDALDTINHGLVTEVAKVTAAAAIFLASSPSPLTGLRVDGYRGGVAQVAWTPSPEHGVTGYRVAWGPVEEPERQHMRVAVPNATIRAAAGSVISVRAVGQDGREGWDWARVTVQTAE